MADEKHRIEQFWAWFRRHEVQFSTLTLDQPFWDIALEQIKKVDEHLWFELSRHRDPRREFIVTTEGHVSSFPIAEELVRLAPNLDRWAFIALKPPQGFQFTTNYEGTVFDPRQMWFLPLVSETRRGELSVRIAVPNLDGMDRMIAHSAVLVILDTGLGERSAALDIQHTEITELLVDPASQGYTALSELAEYIEWRKRRSVM